MNLKDCDLRKKLEIEKNDFNSVDLISKALESVMIDNQIQNNINNVDSVTSVK